jgi:hypothetical protein
VAEFICAFVGLRTGRSRLSIRHSENLGVFVCWVSLLLLGTEAERAAINAGEGKGGNERDSNKARDIGFLELEVGGLATAQILQTPSRPLDRRSRVSGAREICARLYTLLNKHIALQPSKIQSRERGDLWTPVGGLVPVGGPGETRE